jgi:GntR family carbon starvation induced transcriptional regulator
LEAKTLSEHAYNLIREEIVSGAMAPGMRLRGQILQQRYGLSAAPIREALARLASDKLVKQEGQKGFRVVPLSLKDAKDIGDLRRLLEVEALKASIAKGKEEWEDRVITTFHRLELAEGAKSSEGDYFTALEHRNRLFHDALVSACDSEWLTDMRSLVFDHHERYRRLSRIQTRKSRKSIEEHRALMNASLSRDVDTAAALIEVHLRRTTDAVEKHLSEQEANDAASSRTIPCES